ncbi:hypothetical protein U9M48_038088 [Paspalum notatum var. saurae]|uniref:Uncharacterized protein n=1 Tax=Paspalum notatum var. saurae TaxID=547442 RepID=A0AAQ3UIK1_PASNO
MSAEEKNEKNKRRREARQRNKGQPMLPEISKDGDVEEDDEWLHRNETYEPSNVERGDIALATDSTPSYGDNNSTIQFTNLSTDPMAGGLGAPHGRHRPMAQGRRDGGVAATRWRATARAPRQPQMAARRVEADGSVMLPTDSSRNGTNRNDSNKEDGVNQLMGKVWDWNNMYGTKLKKFDESVLAANEDGGRCEDDVTALREDRRDDPKDDSSGPESSADIDDWQDGHRVVQFLAISANFPICSINGYDGEHGRCIYAHLESEVQEDGMVDLVPIGPCELLMAYGAIGLEIFYYTTARDEGHFVREDEGGLRPLGPRIIVQWNVDDNDEIEGYTKTISPGRSHTW